MEGETPMRTITQAATILADGNINLEGSYNNSWGKLWNTTGGGYVKNVLMFLAVTLAVLMFFALICRLLQRAPQFSNRFFGSGQTIAFNLIAIALLASPTLIPVFLKIIDGLVNFVSQYGLGVVTGS